MTDPIEEKPSESGAAAGGSADASDGRKSPPSATTPPPAGLPPTNPANGTATSSKDGAAGGSSHSDSAGDKEVYLTGYVKTYSTRKGFGFITSEHLQSICGDIFVYNTHLVGRIGLIAGERVEFVLFYDPQTLRPQARNVRVLEPPPSADGKGGEKDESKESAANAPPTAEQMEKLKKIKDDAWKKAQEVKVSLGGHGAAGGNNTQNAAMGGGMGAIGMGLAESADVKLSSPNGTTAAGGHQTVTETIRRAQEDAQKKLQHEAALMHELSHHKDDYLYYPPQYQQMEGARPVPPKTLIPVGSEVTIIDFPIRELNGAKGVIKAFDTASCRYKVEVNDAKKGPQEFLMPKEKLRIDTLTLPASAEIERQMREKQAAAKEILTAAINGNPGSNPTSAQRTSTSSGFNNTTPGGPPGSAQKQTINQSSPLTPNQPYGAPPGGPGQPQAASNPAAAAAALHHLQAAQQQAQAQAAQAHATGKMKGGLAALPGGLLPGTAGIMQPGAYGQTAISQQLLQLKGKGLLNPAMAGKLGFLPGAVPGKNGVPQPGYIDPNLALFYQQKGLAPRSPLDPYGAKGALDLLKGKVGLQQMPPQQPVPPQQQQQQPPKPEDPAAAQQQQQQPAQPPASPAGIPKGALVPEPTPEETSGTKGTKWRVRVGCKDFADAIVREKADMSSNEVRRLVPGDVCVQNGETLRVDPGVVRMPIEPMGWVTVHARAIGGPTFLELLPEDPVVEEEPDYGDVPGLNVEERVYPLPFLLRFKLVAPVLEDDHPAKGLQVAKLAEARAGHRTKDKDRTKREPGDRDAKPRMKGDGKKGMNGDGKGYYDKDGGHQGKDQGYGKGGSVPGSGDSRMEQKGKSGYREHDQGQHRGDNGGKGGYSDRSRGGGEAYDGRNEREQGYDGRGRDRGYEKNYDKSYGYDKNGGEEWWAQGKHDKREKHWNNGHDTKTKYNDDYYNGGGSGKKAWMEQGSGEKAYRGGSGSGAEKGSSAQAIATSSGRKEPKDNAVKSTSKSPKVAEQDPAVVREVFAL
eukprot:g10027.t1